MLHASRSLRICTRQTRKGLQGSRADGSSSRAQGGMLVHGRQRQSLTRPRSGGPRLLSNILPASSAIGICAGRRALALLRVRRSGRAVPQRHQWQRAGL